MIFALIGALANRLRGSDGLPRWLRLLIFGGCYAYCCFLLGVAYPMALLSGVLLAAAVTPSHGEYVGSLGGVKGHWYDLDYKGGTYDFAIKWAVGKRQLWGFAGLLVKGLVMGLAMTPAIGPIGIVIGSLMPVCYFVGVSFGQIFLKKNTFEPAEFLHGAVIFGLTYLSTYGILHDA